MKTITIHQLRSNWLLKENELLKWRPRRYLHFDEILDKVTRRVFDKIVNPKEIAQHAFFPFIKREDKTRLYKKDAETKQKFVKEKLRPIAYASHFDAVIYSWYAYLLSYFYEKLLSHLGLEKPVIAYRSLGKSNVQFADEVFQFVRDQGECVVITSDIKGFYDNLDHKKLKQKWARLFSRKDLALDHHKVFKSVTTYSFVEMEKLKKILKTERPVLSLNLLGELRDKKAIGINPDKKGIPQGAPISCTLSNVYMLEFDETIENFVKGKGGLYRRYSDDILIVCPLDIIRESQEMLNKAIEKEGLEIEASKTETFLFRPSTVGMICTTEDGTPAKLQYLGVIFDGKVSSLRHKGYAKFGRKMTRAVDREVRVAKKKGVAVAKRKLYEKFTPLGKMNYVKYARSASRTLESPLIAKSVRQNRLIKKIKKRIEKGMS